MEPKVYVNELRMDDPLFFIKKSVNDSSNYLHDKTQRDKESLRTRFFFVISLALTVLSSLFNNNLIFTLTIINISALFLIFWAKEYKKKRETFWENRKQMKKAFQKLGMEWRD